MQLGSRGPRLQPAVQVREVGNALDAVEEDQGNLLSLSLLVTLYTSEQDPVLVRPTFTLVACVPASLITLLSKHM